MMRIGILISGRGSNMVALVRAAQSGQIQAEVGIVVSNGSDAPGLELARRAGVEAVAIPHDDYRSREAHEEAVVDALQKGRVDVVCLAGYMRLLGKRFLQAFPERVVNIHPSLLPAFPGLDAQRQAFEHGVRLTGATVHFVDEELDHGPIIVQEAVPVLKGDDRDSLAARVLEVEHRIYPLAVGLLCAGRVQVDGRRVRLAPDDRTD